MLFNLYPPGHGRAGLRPAPTTLRSDVGYNGQRNGIFDNFVSVDFHWSFDSNVVGAARREALPGRRFFVFEGRGVSFWHPSAADPLIT